MSELRRDCSDKELDNNRKEKECSTSSKDDDYTQTTVAADIPVKSESSNNAEWESIDNGKLLIYTPLSVENQEFVIGYSLDNTLIKTKSGLESPENHDDWIFLYPNVHYVIKQFYIKKYKIVIFTNQANLNLIDKIDLDKFKQKIENIVKQIGVPIQVFIATGHNIYRKPAIGMWDYLQEEKNGCILIEKKHSYYVGDAAGRLINWNEGKNKVPCFDLLFALNLGVKFRSPEEHFENKKLLFYHLPSFNPKKNLLPIDNLDVTKFMRKEQEIVLMVGSPGSGKSRFVKHYLKEYGYINTGTLEMYRHGRQKCIAMIEHYLDQGQSVVIDNTNLNPVTRQKYTKIAKKRKIAVRCFVMKTSIDHVKHNIKFRSLTDPSYGPVNDNIIDSYTKSYVSPILEEGFKEILSVEFNYMPKYVNKEDQRLYEMYLVETCDVLWPYSLNFLE